MTLTPYDVLVLGAGLAGQRAALAAAESGATVALLSKVHPVRSHSVAAAGGVNAAVGDGDSWEQHAADTVEGAGYLADQDAVEVLCSEAAGEIRALERQGVAFHRDAAGRLATRGFGGAGSHDRAVYVADITGQAMLHVLYEQLLRRHEPIDRYEEWFVTTLLRDADGRCTGCVARHLRSGNLVQFRARSTILATGGAGQCFRPTTNAAICTGDGIALAYRAGAELMDMEMVQYHPTTLAEHGILVSELARAHGAQLYNARGERFMERYAPDDLERASRDVVARAEQTEIDAGRGFPGGTVALDVTGVPRRRTVEALREVVNLGRDFAGVDVTREPIQVRPGMHYLMGGVRIDVDGATSVPGLYAAGETACASCHGANRLAGNSLLDALVFGRRAGAHAAAAAREIPDPAPAPAAVDDQLDRIEAIGERRRRGAKVPELRRELGDAMHRGAGVLRDAEGLAGAHLAIRDTMERAPGAWVDDRGAVFNQDIPAAIELEHLLDLAECVVVAAAARTESRGAHFRTDHPARDDERWLEHIVLTAGEPGAPPRLGRRPVAVTRWAPQERSA